MERLEQLVTLKRAADTIDGLDTYVAHLYAATATWCAGAQLGIAALHIDGLVDAAAHDEPTITLTRHDANTAIGWWTDTHPDGGAAWDRALIQRLAPLLDGNTDGTEQPSERSHSHFYATDAGSVQDSQTRQTGAERA